MYKLKSLVLEDDYKLIGIHTSLEAYKLAYLINKHFSISFERATYDLDMTYKDSFAH
ncbi:MAG: IPExxxVDY family protein, partial [Psychroflexus salarius]